MFSSGCNYNKLKTNLRLAINRLKLLEKKKTELAQKARKEIADYIAGKLPMNFILMKAEKITEKNTKHMYEIFDL